MNTHSGDLLYSTPREVSGSELSEIEMLTIATHRHPNKKYVTLKNWMIIDILCTEPELQEIKRTKKNPIVVYYSLNDSTTLGVQQEDNKSYSGYQISYNDGFFETEESVYLLMGKGFRKTASAGLVSLLRE